MTKARRHDRRVSKDPCPAQTGVMLCLGRPEGVRTALNVVGNISLSSIITPHYYLTEALALYIQLGMDVYHIKPYVS
jgi:hypothetical protein